MVGWIELKSHFMTISVKHKNEGILSIGTNHIAGALISMESNNECIVACQQLSWCFVSPCIFLTSQKRLKINILYKSLRSPVRTRILRLLHNSHNKLLRILWGITNPHNPESIRTGRKRERCKSPLISTRMWKSVVRRMQKWCVNRIEMKRMGQLRGRFCMNRMRRDLLQTLSAPFWNTSWQA